MGRVSDWLIEMEEDAFCMTRDEWTAKHGESCIDIYNKLRTEWLDNEITPNEPQEHGKPDEDGGQLRCPSCWLREQGEKIKPLDRGGYYP